jgi:regulatory protein
VNPKRPLSLKVRALQWLAQREHSRSELRQRLLRLALAPHAAPRAAVAAEAAAEPGLDEQVLAADEPADHAAEVDALLDWLQAHRYLNDARFIESRVQVRAQRFGNARIEGELRQHGVAVDTTTRQQLRDTEFDRARALWQRKYGTAAPDPAARMKQMRFLAGRGFSADVVRKVVKGADNDLA